MTYSLLMGNYDALVTAYGKLTPYSLLMGNYDALFTAYGKL